jgi:hypothetical protein
MASLHPLPHTTRAVRAGGATMPGDIWCWMIARVCHCTTSAWGVADHPIRAPGSTRLIENFWEMVATIVLVDWFAMADVGSLAEDAVGVAPTMIICAGNYEGKCTVLTNATIATLVTGGASPGVRADAAIVARQVAAVAIALNLAARPAELRLAAAAVCVTPATVAGTGTNTDIEVAVARALNVTVCGTILGIAATTRGATPEVLTRACVVGLHVAAVAQAFNIAVGATKVFVAAAT